MSRHLLISSAHNSKIKLVNRLRSKRGRAAEMRFVIDYERDLRRALGQGYGLDFVLYCPDNIETPDLDGEIHEITPQLLKHISYRENPDGLVAVMHSQPTRRLPALLAAEMANALVLVDLRVPGNIGALLRSADAAAIDAVMLVDTALDLYNPNIIRSSTGACFLDNIFHLSSGEAMTWLRQNGFHIVSADVHGTSKLFDVDFQRPTAIVLGSEDNGISANWIDRADSLVRIPMDGRLTDSLNVSVSGAILMYELYRQRQSSRTA